MTLKLLSFASVIGVVASAAAADGQELGRSRQGRPIPLISMTAPAGGAPSTANKPAVLIVAGIDGRLAAGPILARGIAKALSEKHADLLQSADVFIIPELNPDGLVRFRQPPSGVRVDSGRALGGAWPENLTDADRDGRSDEDGPVDLNGDGRITMMRLMNPRPGLGGGIEPTLIAEPDDPRLMRAADRGKGELPVYAVLVEGKDQDGDGQIGEDASAEMGDGVDLGMNFPYHWPEFRNGAGRSAVSEPETLALVKWLNEHPRVCAVVVLGTEDNLVNPPGGSRPGDGMDQTGQLPVSGNVLNDDKGAFESISKEFKEITKLTATSPAAQSKPGDGSLAGWAYAHMGAFAFASPVWVRPDLVKKDEKKEEKKAEEPKADAPKPTEPSAQPPADAAAPIPRASPPAEPPKPERKKVDSDDGKWIAYSDELVAAGKPGGFAEWTPFDHPTLGKVEIGGFIPGFRLDPPESEIERLTDEQTRFVAALLGKLPRLRVDPPLVEKLGEGLWRVTVRVVNEGFLPTRSAMGARTRRLPNTRLTLDVDLPRIVSGQRMQGSPSITGSGGTLIGEWTFAAGGAGTVTVKLQSPECGDRDVVVELK